jgi:acyl-CoA thioesterase-2
MPRASAAQTTSQARRRTGPAPCRLASPSVTDVAPLATLLDLRPLGDDAFTAPTHGPDAGVERVYGGHVAAQALLAATRTVPADRSAHSVHLAFVRSGRPGLPVRLDVTRDRDGRSFATRRVTVRQKDAVIMEMMASFHVEEPGDDWTATPILDVPGPEETPGRSFLHELPTLGVFDWRVTGETVPGEMDATYPHWVRTVEALPDDPAVHRAVVCGMTDIAAVRGTMRPGFERGEGGFTGASLDHAVWFHRPARADEWMLFTMDSMSNHAARGFGIGRAWSADGRHIASWAQESLIRHHGGAE